MSPGQPLNLQSTTECRLFQNEEFLSSETLLGVHLSFQGFFKWFLSSNVVFFSWECHFAVMSVDDAKSRKESRILPPYLLNFMREILQICEKPRKEQKIEKTPSVCLSRMFQRLFTVTELSIVFVIGQIRSSADI